MNTRNIKNMKVGFTSVVGDLMHAGHIQMIQECTQHCDYLIVGILNDPTIDRPESKEKPVQSLFERYVQLVNTVGVDEVIPLNDEHDLELALSMLPINIRFVGSDYLNKDFTGKSICASRNIEIFYNNRIHGLSSTELKNRIRNSKGVTINA